MIFIDTTEWVSAIDSSDRLHEDGRLTVSAVARGDLHGAVTTDFVLDETLTLLRRRGAKSDKVVESVGDILSSKLVTTVFVDRELLSNALSKFAKFRRLSFTDAVTLEVMKQLSISEIYTHDSDFDLKGIIRRVRP